MLLYLVLGGFYGHSAHLAVMARSPEHALAQFCWEFGERVKGWDTFNVIDVAQQMEKYGRDEKSKASLQNLVDSRKRIYDEPMPDLNPWF